MSVSGPHDLPIDHMPETRTHKRCRCLRMDHTSAAHTRAPGPPKRPGLQPEAHMSERPTHMSDGTPPAGTPPSGVLLTHSPRIWSG